MSKLISVVAVASMLAIVAGPAEAAKPKQVWEDADGDADMGQGGGSIPAGFDLAGGTIVKNKKNLEFTVMHHDMPPSGSAPEGFRFLWNFTVDKEPYRFTVKSVDIGKPDVLAGQTDERVGSIDPEGHFRLEGECTSEPIGGAGPNAVNCPPVAYLEGTWNPDEMSFTIVLPMKTVKAKPGTIIGSGQDQICLICWVSHTAERSLSPQTVIDSAAQTTNYKVPKK
jgi:hypothetical protein